MEVNGIQFTSGSGPQCQWTRLTQGEMERRLGTPPVYDEPDPLPDVEPLPTDREPTDEEVDAHDTATRAHDDEQRRRDAARATERVRQAQPSMLPLSQNGAITDHGMFTAICEHRNIPGSLIALDTPEPLLQQALRDRVTAQIELPDPDINPPLDVGGIVNLGMWLAVTPQDPIQPITAEIPGRWITAYPAHESVTFHFGDGTEHLTCDGAGTPIPAEALDEADPSPTCGHVYRQSSPDDAPYQLSIDTTWTIPYESSTGSGTLAPFTRQATFTYDVDEIQTVGTA